MHSLAMAPNGRAALLRRHDQDFATIVTKFFKDDCSAVGAASL
jgi:hypothetical protein